MGESGISPTFDIWRFPQLGYPQMVGLYGKIPLKWMMHGGTPISGNLGMSEHGGCEWNDDQV